MGRRPRGVRALGTPAVRADLAPHGRAALSDPQAAQVRELRHDPRVGQFAAEGSASAAIIDLKTTRSSTVVAVSVERYPEAEARLDKRRVARPVASWCTNDELASRPLLRYRVSRFCPPLLARLFARLFGRRPRSLSVLGVVFAVALATA